MFFIIDILIKYFQAEIIYILIYFYVFITNYNKLNINRKKQKKQRTLLLV
jgi:hypothetical protein